MAGECCGGGKGRRVLIYACSGGANVAEAADLAARQLAADSLGTMFCLAGLGADVPGMVQTARDADVSLVIDGCAMDCARKVFARHDMDDVRHIRVTDLGIEKTKGIRATPAEVARVVKGAVELLK